MTNKHKTNSNRKVAQQTIRGYLHLASPIVSTDIPSESIPTDNSDRTFMSTPSDNKKRERHSDLDTSPTSNNINRQKTARVDTSTTMTTTTEPTDTATTENQPTPEVQVLPKKIDNTRRNELNTAVDALRNLSVDVDMTTDQPVPMKTFKVMYEVLLILASTVTTEFTNVDKVIDENDKLTSVNQNMTYTHYRNGLKSDLEKASRTIKILDHVISPTDTDEIITNNTETRTKIKTTLKQNCPNITDTELMQARVDIKARKLRNGKAPITLTVPDKERKDILEQKLRTSKSEKIVYEWPQSIYKYTKAIREAYTSSPDFAKKQIMIRPSAEFKSLTVSARSSFNEHWSYVESLKLPVNPKDLEKFGLRKQPCLSKNPSVIFNFPSLNSIYPKVSPSGVQQTQDNFTQPKKTSKNTTIITEQNNVITENRFDSLSPSTA